MLKFWKRKIGSKEALAEIEEMITGELRTELEGDVLLIVYPSGVKGEITFLSKEISKKVLDRAKRLISTVKVVGKRFKQIKEVDRNSEILLGVKHEMRFNRGYIASFPFIKAVKGKDYEVFIGKDGEVEVYGNTEKASRIVEIILGGK